jgi:2-keto-4-pentenoate hydratase/2-oxohepta-3-ene-1,7-dioic acid hydratase in catechol pathway
MFRTICLMVVASIAVPAGAADGAKYVRFQAGDTVAYGLLDGDRVVQLDGDLFGSWSKSDTTHSLAEVKLLPPTEPTQVLALAGNYRSHLSSDTIPPKLQIPQPFHKSPSCLIGHGEAIVLPSDSKDVHYEAEIVVVIGKTCRNVSQEQASDYVFGVTAGNDISERIWQNDEEVKDIQWWRAKGADTFGPVGPCIATDVDFDNLMLRLKLNGETRQEENSDHLIHGIPKTVSFISRYVTLHPGDLIFMGTPGKTAAIRPGDVVEVEIDGIGVLRNPVVAQTP